MHAFALAFKITNQPAKQQQRSIARNDPRAIPATTDESTTLEQCQREMQATQRNSNMHAAIALSSYQRTSRSEGKRKIEIFDTELLVVGLSEPVSNAVPQVKSQEPKEISQMSNLSSRTPAEICAGMKNQGNLEAECSLWVEC
jgi:hypothetical protein